MQVWRRTGMIVPKQPIGSLDVSSGNRAPTWIGGRFKAVDIPTRDLCKCRRRGNCQYYGENS